MHDAVDAAAVGRLDIRLDDVDGSRSFLRAPAPRWYCLAIDCKRTLMYIVVIFSNRIRGIFVINNLLGQSICAYNVLYIVIVWIQEGEGGGSEPDPFSVFSSKPVHQRDDLAF